MKSNWVFLELLRCLYNTGICSRSLISLFHIGFQMNHKEKRFFCNLHVWMRMRLPTRFLPIVQWKGWRIRNLCMIYFRLLHSLSFGLLFLLCSLGRFHCICILLNPYLSVINLAYLRIYLPYIYSLKLFII